jgi:hypothetical protein
MEQQERSLRKQRTRGKGITTDGLRLWGITFAAAGVIGRGLIQNGLLHVSSYTNAELLDAMETSSGVMNLATWGILLQFMGYCALPVFVALLVEGFAHTANLKNYALRIGIMALVCEIPYNLAMSGTWLDTSSRNPIFGLLVCIGMLYLMRTYGTKGNRVQKVLFTAVMLIFAAAWTVILRIEGGIVMVCLAATLWLLRYNLLGRLMLGCLICVFQFPSMLGMMCVHAYNGEKGKASRKAVYGWYPVLLIIVGVANLILR